MWICEQMEPEPTVKYLPNDNLKADLDQILLHKLVVLPEWDAHLQFFNFTQANVFFNATPLKKDHLLAELVPSTHP